MWMILLTFIVIFIFPDIQSVNPNPRKYRLPDLSMETGWGEKNLIKNLLTDYDRRSRPVVDDITPRYINHSINVSVEQITVEFGLGLIQILDLDEMEQVLTTSVRSLYRWTDYHLIWNPAEYDGVKEINIPPSEIWLPDIALYNYADERLEERRECDVKVSYNGTVEWHPMAIYKSTCSVRIKYFPFDKQGCKLKFGAWTYDGFRVNLSFYDGKDNLDMANYVKSPEWDILGSKAIFKEITYPCCPEPYPDISFYIWIERQPAFYNYILILPCFLLSSLTLVLFWLPPETPAKMVLGMNIFVAFFLLLLLLEDTTPSASASFPLIGTYYCLNMAIITLSTFLCLIVVNFHFRGDNRREVPYWLKKLAIHHGARLLCVTTGPRKRRTPSSDNDDSEAIPLRSAPNPPHYSNHRHSNFGGVNPYEDQNNIGRYGNVNRVMFDHTQNFPGMPWSPKTSPRLNDFAQSNHINTTTPKLIPYDSNYNSPGFPSRTPPELRHSDKYSPESRQFRGNSRRGGGFGDSEKRNRALMRQAYSLDNEKEAMTYNADNSNYRDAHDQHAWDRAGLGDSSLFLHQAMSSLGSCMNEPSGPMSRSDYFRMEMMEEEAVKKTRRQSGRRGLNSMAFSGYGGIGGVMNQTPPSTKRGAQRALSLGENNHARGMNSVTRDVNDIIKCLHYVKKANENKERVSKIIAEWRAVGMVLDRLFFFSYVFAIILSIILFFPKSGDDVKVNDTDAVQ